MRVANWVLAVGHHAGNGVGWDLPQEAARTLMAFSRTHHVKGALLVTHSGQQTRQRDDEYQHNNWVRHISSLRTLIRTSEPNFTALEAMLGGEAVWIDQLPPLLREPLPATAPRQRLRREPIITCFGHALIIAAQVPGSRASADRKRPASPIGEPGQGPRGDDRRRMVSESRWPFAPQKSRLCFTCSLLRSLKSCGQRG